MNIPENADICVTMPKSARMAFVLYFPIVIPCLLERVLPYFNVYRKLEVFLKDNFLKENDAVSRRQKNLFFL